MGENGPKVVCALSVTATRAHTSLSFSLLPLCFTQLISLFFFSLLHFTLGSRLPFVPPKTTCPIQDQALVLFPNGLAQWQPILYTLRATISSQW